MFNFLKKTTIFCMMFFLIISLFLFFLKYPFQEKKIDVTSSKYEEIIEKIDIKKDKIVNEAKNFINHNNNIYGTLVAMFLAKQYVLNHNLDQAYMHLNNALKYTTEENLKNVLKLRIAKIKMQKKEDQKAIQILESIKNHNWDSIIEHIKGDIFINQNNKKLALKSWKKSLSMDQSNASKDIINMKINEIK